MKFAIAVHGTRGDVEPAAAVALELQRRGHQVRMAVPPNLVGFAESAGLRDVQSYGPDSQKQLEAEIFRDWWKLRNPLTVLRQAREYVTDGWAEMNETLVKLSGDADLILTGTTYQEVAANVAEAQGIPLAALHYFPARPNTHLLPVKLPLKLVEPVFAIAEWGHWRMLKPADDQQRRNLGLPRSGHRATKRIVDGGALEIQAYDPILFPRLEQEYGTRRPLVGSITLQLPTAEDATVTSWVAAGSPPIYFGFGSMPVDDPAEAVAMISGVCRELGQRALICSGVLALEGIPDTPDMMIVPSVNHAAVFPNCRAIVHHGGAGTTSASLRSGVPTLVLWVGADQPVWAEAVKRVGAGTAHRFSTTTPETLRADLRTVLGPTCTARAKEVAAAMIPPARSLADTVDLLERKAAAGLGR
ncbi:MAG TPA: glycosyltransferase [Mycobacterium sp.]|nr:glycosyltransferase [Mycobacterium sp.]